MYTIIIFTDGNNEVTSTTEMEASGDTALNQATDDIDSIREMQPGTL